MIAYTGALRLPSGQKLMCTICMKDAEVLWVAVADGDTDNEQYVCDACAVLLGRGLEGPPVSLPS